MDSENKAIVWCLGILAGLLMFTIGSSQIYYHHKHKMMLEHGYTQRSVPQLSSPRWVAPDEENE